MGRRFPIDALGGPARQHAEVHNWNLIAEFLASVEQNTTKQPVDQ